MADRVSIGELCARIGDFRSRLPEGVVAGAIQHVDQIARRDGEDVYAFIRRCIVERDAFARKVV